MSQTPKLKTLPPDPRMTAFVNDLKAILAKHQHLTAEAMLAGTCQLVGNLIALQDQRYMTPAMALEVVQANIEIGNRIACEIVSKPQGSA